MDETLTKWMKFDHNVDEFEQKSNLKEKMD
jgi:hypothetical protein